MNFHEHRKAHGGGIGLYAWGGRGTHHAPFHARDDFDCVHDWSAYRRAGFFHRLNTGRAVRAVRHFNSSCASSLAHRRPTFSRDLPQGLAVVYSETATTCGGRRQSVEQTHALCGSTLAFHCIQKRALGHVLADRSETAPSISTHTEASLSRHDHSERHLEACSLNRGKTYPR